MVEANPGARNRRRLGRGLASLMSQPVTVPTEPPQPKQGAPSPEASTPRLPAESGQRGLRMIEAGEITPNPYQPRKEIDAARLEALAASIRQSGVMQPILLRTAKTGKGYELIAGERRWRAAQLAGLKALPAIICDLADSEAAEWALVENLQREDLDPIERAEAFQSLVAEFNLTHSQIAERVGMDRSSVANTIRLNTLDDETKADVRGGRVSQGHAKVLLSISDPKLRRTLVKALMRDSWSVRRLEREVEACLNAQAGKPRATADRPKAPHITDLEERLSKALRLPARIKQSKAKNSGQIVLTFRTLEEFEALLARVER